MVEAGADEVPEDVLLEALDLAHQEIRKLCEAQEDLRRQVGKAKWLDPELTAELESLARAHDLGAHPGRRACARRAAVDRGARGRAGPRSDDGLDRGGHRTARCRSAPAWTPLLEKARLAAVEGPVREQFENDLRALTDAEQDSKELKSAKRHLLFDRIVETVQLPFPVGPATVDGEAPAVEGLGHEAATSRRPPRRSTRTSSARRSRSTSGARTAAAPTRSGRSSARSAVSPRDARLGALPRAARRRS